MNAGASASTERHGRNTAAASNAQRDRAPQIPPEYSRVTGGSYELYARNDVLSSLQQVLATHDSLYEWASHLPQPIALRGRAPVYIAALPESEAVVAVRHAWHGGLFAPLTRDRFRAPTRAGVELENSLRLRELGIGTSEILGYVLYKAGPGLRRVDVASRFIPGTVDFGAVLTGSVPQLNTASSLPALRLLLIALAQQRAVHPDLNVKNILLRSMALATAPGVHPPASTSSDVSALVIDVDVVRFEPNRSAADVMTLNVSRLVRSIRKWRVQFGADMNDDMIKRFECECVEGVE